MRKKGKAHVIPFTMQGKTNQLPRKVGHMDPQKEWPDVTPLLHKKNLWRVKRGNVSYALVIQNTSPANLEKHTLHSCVFAACVRNAIMRGRRCASPPSNFIASLQVLEKIA